MGFLLARQGDRASPAPPDSSLAGPALPLPWPGQLAVLTHQLAVLTQRASHTLVRREGWPSCNQQATAACQGNWCLGDVQLHAVLLGPEPLPSRGSPHEYGKHSMIPSLVLCGSFCHQTQALGFRAYASPLCSLFFLLYNGNEHTAYQSPVGGKCLGSRAIQLCTKSVVLLTAIPNPRGNSLKEKLHQAFSIFLHPNLSG